MYFPFTFKTLSKESHVASHKSSDLVLKLSKVLKAVYLLTEDTCSRINIAKWTPFSVLSSCFIEIDREYYWPKIIVKATAALTETLSLITFITFRLYLPLSDMVDLLLQYPSECHPLDRYWLTTVSTCIREVLWHQI